ncbi:MAG TPA: hypothetical protein VN515_10415 [Terriglobales bacterium]|nr:hypothetical protein [Terriglobales bacterium]
MAITARGLWTLLHGMGFGALFLLACSGALVELGRGGKGDSRFLRHYLGAMALLAWAAVLSGAYLIYPWYRAVPPAGAALAGFPQRLLQSNPATAGWHAYGMEWKEHVAWFAPIAVTMAWSVVAAYGGALARLKTLRRAVLGFVAAAMVAAALAGFFGAMLNKNAPVMGGPTLHLAEGR